jgi:hypothetical protein
LEDFFAGFFATALTAFLAAGFFAVLHETLSQQQEDDPFLQQEFFVVFLTAFLAAGFFAAALTAFVVFFVMSDFSLSLVCSAVPVFPESGFR